MWSANRKLTERAVGRRDLRCSYTLTELWRCLSMDQPSGTAQESPAHSKRCLAGGTYDLLIAQDFDGVHLSSAASRDVSCDYGDGCKQDRDAQIRDRVSRGDAEQETGHQAREDQRCNQSAHNADSCQQNPLFEDQSKDVCWSRSECHAKTKFFRAARNRIGDYAVNSDRGDDERNSGEQTEQQSEK